MKANVVKAYTDRITGELHLKGETVDLSDERAAELSELGFVEVAEAPKPRARKAPARKTAHEKEA